MRVLSALICSATLAGCGGTALAPSTSRAANGAVSEAANRRFHELFRFDGEGHGKHPTGRLILTNGVAYGITRSSGRGPTFSGGVVFSFTPAAGEQILHVFKGGTKDGEDPSSLIFAGGKFYGTTFGGGSHRHGVVFSLSPSGSEQILYSFAGGNDGDAPNDLVAVKNRLYGTTETGGAYLYGTLFEMTTSGKKTILHSFSGPPDGAGPSGRLVVSGSTIYGTTGLGGVTGDCYVEGCGTIFSVTTAGVEQTVYDFQGGADGYFPIDLVMLDGTIYGETMERGSYNLGTVFAITASGVRVVYAFQPGDGYDPQGLSAINDSLYGTLAFGNDGGSLFKLTPSGELTRLHHFYGHDGGIWPGGDLIDVNGTLEGETVYGGDAHSEGTIYAYAL